MTEHLVVTFLIPWQERADITLTLAANEPVFSQRDSEILVINCGGSSDQLHQFIANSAVGGIRQVDLPNCPLTQWQALNIGSSLAKAPLLFMLPPDMILLSDVVAEGISLLEKDSFVTVEWVQESKAAHFSSQDIAELDIIAASEIEVRFRDGIRIRHRLDRRSLFTSRHAGQSLLLARKEHFLAVDGFNSNLDDCGWADDDIRIRLQRVLGLRHAETGNALHLNPGSSIRGRTSTNAKALARCCRKYVQGMFRGTYSADVAAHRTLVQSTVVSCDNKMEAGKASCNPEQKEAFFSHGPAYCGDSNAKIMGLPRDLDWSAHPPSVDQLLIEAAILKHRRQVRSQRLLQIGIGNGHLAMRLAEYFDAIDGVTISAAEENAARGLCHAYDRIFNCNKFSCQLLACTAGCAYDIIVDNNIASYACCVYHVKQLMKAYASLLAPRGILYTSEIGMNWYVEAEWQCLTAAALVDLAEEVGLTVRASGCGFMCSIS